MKAVIIRQTGKAELADIPEQSMRPDYIKVKTVAVALNPTDFLHTDGAGAPGGILGCDFSGIVEEVGPQCKTDVKKGDRVFGVCHCANNNNLEDGAYGETTMAKDGHLAKIPKGISFEDAATMGAAVTTVGQALYLDLKLPTPEKPARRPFPVLIYGGSTATGALAIQYAKLSGLTVVTTASRRNFALVKSRGADAVFDYNDPDCGAKIRAFTDDRLRHALDCISVASSYRICAEALSSNDDSEGCDDFDSGYGGGGGGGGGGEGEELHCLALLPTDGWPRPDVKVRWMLAYTSFGEEFVKFGTTYPPNREHYETGVWFWRLNAELLAQGKIKMHPVEVREGGFGKLPEGIDDLRRGRVSAKKLVYRTADTPGMKG